MNQLLSQIQDVQDKLTALNDEGEFYDPDTANISGTSHASQSTLEYFEFRVQQGPDGCATVCQTNGMHVCEFCLEPHRSIECPRHPGWTLPAKGVGKGKGKNKAKKLCEEIGHHRRFREATTGFWCGVRDDFCPKTHRIQHSRQHQSRSVPLEVSGEGGEAPFLMRPRITWDKEKCNQLLEAKRV